MFARLLNPKASPSVAVLDPPTEMETGPTVDTIEIALPCAVVPRFAEALSAIMDVLKDDNGIDAEPVHDRSPFSPLSLEALLATAISRSCGAGRPSVSRSPAGLYSPEYWRISVADASRSVVDIVTLASRGATTRA